MGLRTTSANPLTPVRNTQAHRHVKDLFGQLDSTFHLGGAAGQDDPGWDQVLIAAAPQLGLNEGEKLVVTGLNNLGQSLSGQLPRWPVADEGNLDGLSGASQFG